MAQYKADPPPYAPPSQGFSDIQYPPQQGNSFCLSFIFSGYQSSDN